MPEKSSQARCKVKVNTEEIFLNWFIFNNELVIKIRIPLPDAQLTLVNSYLPENAQLEVLNMSL